MWTCNCGEDGRGPRGNYVKLTETTVMGDNTCVRCGFYAMWQEESDITYETKSTIYKVGYKKPVKRCRTRQEAADFLGIKSTNHLHNAFSKKIPYSPLKSNYVLIPWRCTEFPEQFKDRILPPKIYVHNIDKGYLGKFDDLKKAAKAVGDSYEIALSNKNRESIHTATGNIYTLNKKFNLKSYLRIKSTTVEFSLASDWKYDTIGYDDSELGVKQETDTYGTWKDLLYS